MPHFAVSKPKEILSLSTGDQYLFLWNLSLYDDAGFGLPHPPKLAGADAFQLFEHTTEVVQISVTAFQTDLLNAFIGKPQHPFRMSDPHLLQVSDQRHPWFINRPLYPEKFYRAPNNRLFKNGTFFIRFEEKHENPKTMTVSTIITTTPNPANEPVILGIK